MSWNIANLNAPYAARRDVPIAVADDSIRLKEASKAELIFRQSEQLTSPASGLILCWNPGSRHLVLGP